MSKHKTRQTNRITNATLQLINDKGLSCLSMSEVADAAGITRQTLYNYFPDIETIIAQALRAHGEAVEHHVLEIIGGENTPYEKLRAFAHFQISNASLEHENISLEAGLSAKTRNQLYKHNNNVKAALRQIIIYGKKNNIFLKDVNPVVASELILGMVESAANVAAKHPKQKPYLIDAAVRAILAAIKV
ncbi:hypothetical protein MNBD_ALPHA11-2208 [hydrothermal vent metagenome]|uniref:HTH tetR-type domain-containing protein n=1 Tax=hydrothermal vent metagenome TaxID=652676 RepID=A0A3B0TNE3_9ZZZZ